MDGSEKVDWLLGRTEDGWEVAREVAAEWEEWDYDNRLTFVAEHGLPESRMRELENLAKEGAMTPEQLARFSRLQALVAELRPVLEGLHVGTPPSTA